LPLSSVTGQDGDVDFVFVSGRPSLDFAGTLKWRHHDPEEQLATPEALREWIDRAGLVTAPVTVDRGALDRGRALREVIYRLASARRTGHHWDDDDLGALHLAAHRPPPALTLEADGTVRRDGGVPAVLAALARDAIELLGGPDAARIRECGRPECTRLYVDSSRTQNRRWCGMAECGNRVKAASYRRRKATRPLVRSEPTPGA
jgi:predicted RNA-binding Zn ribbon-like protein